MKVLVIGAALSGCAVAKLCAAKGMEVTLTDKKEIPEKEALEALGIQVYPEGHPDHLKEVKWDMIVKNPGIPDYVPFVSYFKEKGYFLYNELEVAQSFANYRYGAVTGTNGKTTTVTILKELLKTLDERNDGVGNIGLPLSDLVLHYGREPLSMAVEISAFQLLGVKNFHPEVSVCTNLTPDHLDVFGDLDNYYKTKMLVYANQKDDDWFLLNLDDENCVKYAKDVPCKVVTYSLYQDADLCLKDGIVYLFGKELFPTQILRIPGMHNVSNAMVAAAMAYKMGVSKDSIFNVLSNFAGVEHRIQFVRELDGVRYYNDSKGTNPDSTIVALKAFNKPVILLGGGYDKHTGFESIKPYRERIKHLVAFGATKHQLQEIVPDAILVEDLAEAVDRAHKLAEDGDIVLLSPMCASWDQFPNFEVRGHEFVRLVQEL
ncbi:MAG: UDP-N-acetylmuramoyl-L-alanine--D-glutamate ligase [Erysipelotrichaceae bacterium]|nr:UDP-N-acetylmuramoyl-L-alanine--D-glutamate ligase [Erysipelotrichaceae bacterium]